MKAEQRVVSRLFASGQYEIKNWSWNIDAKSVREKEFNDCFCLVYVQKGNLAKVSYNVSAGRVAIEKPDFDYQLVAGEGQCTIINFSKEMYLRLTEDIGLNKLFERRNTLRVIARTSPESEYMLWTLLRQLGAIDKFQRDQIVVDLLHDALSATPISSAEPQHNTAAISIAKDYINHAFPTQLSLFDLSRHCGVSPFYFARMFKSHTGYSPHQYLLNVRLKHGEMLLHNKDLSIADITYSSGFSSPEYFSARFRKKYKMTPTEYRKECQRPRVFQ